MGRNNEFYFSVRIFNITQDYVFISLPCATKDNTCLVIYKFADIFRLNSINIGLVPIETSQENVDALFAKIEATPSTNILISIENKTVQCEEIAFSFELDDFSQKRILEGLDKIDITLGYTDQIDSFSKSRKKWMPKLV